MLSIVTVTYRDTQGLIKTLSSLEKAIRKNVLFEQIILDSSPQENLMVLKNKITWPFIHVSRPSDGIYRAMNEGISKANGDYLWFLNSGDALFSEESLIKMINIMKENPEYGAICGAAIVERGGKYCYTLYPRKTMKDSLISGRSLCHQAIIYNKKVFRSLGNYSEDFIHVSDEEYHFRLLCSGFNVICVNEKLVIYDNQGISRKDFKLRYKELNFVRKNIIRKKIFLADYFVYSLNYYRNFFRMCLIYFIERTFLKSLFQPIWLFWLRLVVRYK